MSVYTPYHGYSNEELLTASSCNANPTDLEIELALRLELLMQELESDLEARAFNEAEIMGEQHDA